jgi:hypothetical protein
VSELVERVLNTYRLVHTLDDQMLADSRQRIGRYIQDLSRAGHSDAHQLAVYGLAYLKEIHQGPDPRFTGC